MKQALYTQLTSLTHGVTQRQTLTRQSSLNTACWMILLLFTPAGISSRLTALRIFLRNVPTSFTLTSASRRAAQISFSISSSTCDSEGRRGKVDKAPREGTGAAGTAPTPSVTVDGGEYLPLRWNTPQPGPHSYPTAM